MGPLHILTSPPLTVDIKPRLYSHSPSINGSSSATPTFLDQYDSNETDDLVLAPLKLPPPMLKAPQSKFPSPPSRPCKIIQAPQKPKPRVTKGRKRLAQSPLETEIRQKARKTAHSDIERRRRIKINEQFEELKYLIPACSQATANGENGLHKLVILQEAVAFIKYLKNCLDSVQSPAVLTRAIGSDTSDVIPGPDRSAKLKIANLLS